MPPFTPAPPFPKGDADPIRPQDYNDLVIEAQRLDLAKVDRSGDAITGSLTIAAELGVGTITPEAALHVTGVALVSDGSGYAVPNGYMAAGSLTLGSLAASFGGGVGWNVNTSGLLLETAEDTEIAVHDSGLRLASVVQYKGGSNSLTVGRDMGWGAIARVVVNGNVGIGVPAPEFELEVGDRIRLRQGVRGTAGVWLYQQNDRAFVGMSDDNHVGLYGSEAGWALTMDVRDGSLLVRNCKSTGRFSDEKLRLSTATSETAVINDTAFTTVPGMNLPFTAAVPATFQILAQLNGVSCSPSSGYVDFRLRVDGGPDAVDFTRHGGPGRTGITLTRLLTLAAGPHSIAVQWRVDGPATSAICSGSDMDVRQIQLIEL
jgi:hypothetical protein